MIGEISLKLHQMNLIVAKINWNIVANELPSQSVVYTCLTIDVWTRRRRRGFMCFRCYPPKLAGFHWKLAPKPFDFIMDTSGSPESAQWEELCDARIFVQTVRKMTWSLRNFLKRDLYFETEGVCNHGIRTNILSGSKSKLLLLPSSNSWELIWISYWLSMKVKCSRAH
jgi:hypothetical protein